MHKKMLLVFSVLFFLMSGNSSELIADEINFFEFEQNEFDLMVLDETARQPKLEKLNPSPVIQTSSSIEDNDLDQSEFSAFDIDDSSAYEEDGFTHYDWWSEH